MPDDDLCHEPKLVGVMCNSNDNPRAKVAIYVTKSTTFFLLVLSASLLRVLGFKAPSIIKKRSARKGALYVTVY